METVNGLASADVQKALLVLLNAVLGAVRVAEGLEALGLFPGLTAARARRVKAGVQVACGILHIAAVLLGAAP